MSSIGLIEVDCIHSIPKIQILSQSKTIAGDQRAKLSDLAIGLNENNQLSTSKLVEFDHSEQDIDSNCPFESVVSPLIKLLRRNIKKEKEKHARLGGIIELSKAYKTSEIGKQLKMHTRKRNRMLSPDDIQFRSNKKISKSINFGSEYCFHRIDDQKSIKLDLQKLPEIRERRESSNISPFARCVILLKINFFEIISEIFGFINC